VSPCALCESGSSSGVDFFNDFNYSNRTKKEIYYYVGSRVGDFELTYCFCESSKRDTTNLSVKIFLQDKIKKPFSYIFKLNKSLLLKLTKSMYVFDLKYYVQVFIMQNIQEIKISVI